MCGGRYFYRASTLEAIVAPNSSEGGTGNKTLGATFETRFSAKAIAMVLDLGPTEVAPSLVTARP